MRLKNFEKICRDNTQQSIKKRRGRGPERKSQVEDRGRGKMEKGE
jgi:hypothetical protein